MRMIELPDLDMAAAQCPIAALAEAQRKVGQSMKKNISILLAREGRAVP